MDTYVGINLCSRNTYISSTFNSTSGLPYPIREVGHTDYRNILLLLCVRPCVSPLWWDTSVLLYLSSIGTLPPPSLT